MAGKLTAIWRSLTWPLCFIGLHSWRRLPDEYCGITWGWSDWMQKWECRRCMSEFDRVRTKRLWEKAWPVLHHDTCRRALEQSKE